MIAEQHRDEFRAVAQYLNELAEHDAERGIAVWLVEAKAVRIAGSPWAPLFSSVVEPNAFTATIEQTKQTERPGSIEEFWDQYDDPHLASAGKAVLSRWLEAGYRRRLGPNHVVLEAPGPSKNGFRTVVAMYADGQVMVPFASYAGMNSGISVDALTTAEFRSAADDLFGLTGTERLARTASQWLTQERVQPFVTFCLDVAEAYKEAMRSPALTSVVGSAETGSPGPLT